LKPAINQEFYSEKEDFIMKYEDLAMFFYIKLNEINFNFTEFFMTQEKKIENENENNNENDKDKDKEKIDINNINEESKLNISSILSVSISDKNEKEKESNIENEDNKDEDIKSKSNLVIHKLKKISQKALLSKDKECLDDIQFIIKLIKENDINLDRDKRSNNLKQNIYDELNFNNKSNNN
jgi:hypothetical protein